MEDILKFLKLIGLTKEEAIIFNSLLRLKEATVLEISQDSNIERTKVYRIIEEMKAKGLLFERLEYKKRYLKPCDISIIKEKALAEINKGKYLDKNLKNSLRKISDKTNDFLSTSVRYYHGVSGIKQVIWNQLKAKDEILTFSYRDLIEIVGRKFFKLWAEEFEKKNLRALDLRSEEFVKSTMKYKPIRLKRDYKKYIDPAILNIISEVDIYNNTVVICDWDQKKEEIYALEIENKKLAQMYKQMFKVFWELGTEYKRSKNAKQ